MRTITTQRGFSLVELLTVIAIIAILAAIIFPVMAMVKDRARQNQCMTNLHQIAMGIKMFKDDNRRYPSMLAGAVDENGIPTGPGGNQAVIFDNAKSDAYLFAEYVNTIKMFHCPSSKITDTGRVAKVPKQPYVTGGNEDLVYTYNGYDAYYHLPTGGNIAERHYCTDWAGVANDVVPYSPSQGPDTAAMQQQDYERQLKFRNPPGDTVVTWCSWHETRIGSPPVTKGRALVVYLDGSADVVDAAKMEACKWRMRPKKG